MSLPTLSWSRTSDVPAATELDISADFAKRITADFGISIGGIWAQIRHPEGVTMAGFNNFDTAFRYQLFKDSRHELALLLGLVVEWAAPEQQTQK